MNFTITAPSTSTPNGNQDIHSTNGSRFNQRSVQNITYQSNGSSIIRSVEPTNSFAVSFQSNGTGNTVSRRVTQSTFIHQYKVPVALFTAKNLNKCRSLSESQAYEPREKNRKEVIVLQDSDVDDVVFVSNTNLSDCEPTRKEKVEAKIVAKRIGCVRNGKVTKHRRRRSCRREIQNGRAIYRTGRQSVDDSVSRFKRRDENSPKDPFPIDGIKLNPYALLAQKEPEPMTIEEEKKLFDEKPEFFEKRMIIIDGSNVAYEFGRVRKAYSVEGIEFCLRYFEERGFNAKVVIPRMRLQRNKSTNPIALNSLYDAGKVCLSPCKSSSICYDDRFILELAKKYDAAVISNDNYRDLLGEDSKWDQIINERVVGFMTCDDFIFLPDDPYGKYGRRLGVILHKRKPIIPAVESVIKLDD